MCDAETSSGGDADREGRARILRWVVVLHRICRYCPPSQLTVSGSSTDNRPPADWEQTRLNPNRHSLSFSSVISALGLAVNTRLAPESASSFAGPAPKKHPSPPPFGQRVLPCSGQLPISHHLLAIQPFLQITLQTPAHIPRPYSSARRPWIKHLPTTARALLVQPPLPGMFCGG